MANRMQAPQKYRFEENFTDTSSEISPMRVYRDRSNLSILRCRGFPILPQRLPSTRAPRFADDAIALVAPNAREPEPVQNAEVHPRTPAVATMDTIMANSKGMNTRVTITTVSEAARRKEKREENTVSGSARHQHRKEKHFHDAGAK